MRELSDEEAVAVSLVENVQRADMHPIDKARAFKALENQRGTVALVAQTTGVTAKTVHRYLALLALPDELQAQVQTGGGHTGVEFMSTLAETFRDPDEAVEVFEKVQGFKGSLASEIVKRSGGRLDDIDELVDQGIAGQFDRAKCGSSVETCPYIPERLRAVARSMIESDD